MPSPPTEITMLVSATFDSLTVQLHKPRGLFLLVLSPGDVATKSIGAVALFYGFGETDAEYVYTPVTAEMLHERNDTIVFQPAIVAVQRMQLVTAQARDQTLAGLLDTMEEGVTHD